MKVAIAHDFVVPRRMVFGKIIRHVQFSFAPDDLKMVLVDPILEPMESHIEGFGEFWTDRSIEDACSSGIVVEKGSAILGLRVT